MKSVIRYIRRRFDNFVKSTMVYKFAHNEARCWCNENEKLSVNNVRLSIENAALKMQLSEKREIEIQLGEHGNLITKLKGNVSLLSLELDRAVKITMDLRVANELYQVQNKWLNTANAKMTDLIK